MNYAFLKIEGRPLTLFVAPPYYMNYQFTVENQVGVCKNLSDLRKSNYFSQKEDSKRKKETIFFYLKKHVFFFSLKILGYLFFLD